METVCNALFGSYLDQFVSFVEDNIKIIEDFPAEFISMKENLVGILKLMEDVENANQGMKSFGHVTNQLRELMYEAEDRVADYSHMKITSRLGIGTKLKDINEKLKEMKSKLENSADAIIASGGKSKREDVVKRRKPDPVNDVTKIFGLTYAIRKIKKWVLNEDNVKYNRIGLVGKGGSGKTTLCEMIMKDQEINQHFQLLLKGEEINKQQEKMMFVSVSQPVDVKMMMKSMLEDLKIHSSDDVDESKMSTKIYDNLKGRRYFLILDDVWSLDGGWWETIKNALPEGSEKSCILITSRMRKIVEDMGVCAERIHVQSELNAEDGWSLFCISAETDVSEEDTEMKEIGMEIVRKCGGLPLAIKVMGGVVSSHEKSLPKWMEIRDKFMEHISNNKNDIVMGSLGLSYEELRLTYLQPCLLCFGVFPEDHVLLKDRMIRWWIGEGFVPLTKDGRVSVELAEQCFDELVNRNLVDVATRDWNGKVLTCKVHNLVREMLIRKGKSEAFFEIGKDKISRRIFLNNDISYSQIIASKAKVRVIINHSMKNFGNIFNDCRSCKYVRVLELLNMDEVLEYKSMFESIGNLKNLTALNITSLTIPLSDEYIKKLSIEKSELLVLCFSLACLDKIPDSITEMKRLIWLDVRGCFSLNYLPKGLGNVFTLQVLKGFVLPSQIDKGCRFEELRRLTQLVTLEIFLTYDSEFSDSELNALSELNGLRHLTINCRVSQENMYNIFVQNFDNLVLPNGLQELKLDSYPGEETPPWLNAEHLPRLLSLYLNIGNNLKCFHENFYASGSDQNKWGIIHLKLYRLPKLQGDWTNAVLERLPYLKTLHSPDHSEIRLENYPTAQEFDEEGVWRRRGEEAA